MATSVQGQPRFDDSLQKVNKTAFISEDATLDVNDQVVDVDSSEDAVTITLPFVGDAVGRIYFITAAAGNTNTVTVEDNDESVQWGGDYSLDAANNSIALMSDGRKWWVVDSTIG